MKAVSRTTPSLLPQALRNLVESANCASRIVLKACQGTERTVEGIDDVATLMLSQQRQRLMAELELEPKLITE